MLRCVSVGRMGVVVLCALVYASDEKLGKSNNCPFTLLIFNCHRSLCSATHFTPHHSTQLHGTTIPSRQMGDAAVMCVCPDGYSGVKCEIAERGTYHPATRMNVQNCRPTPNPTAQPPLLVDVVVDSSRWMMMMARQAHRGSASVCLSVRPSPPPAPSKGVLFYSVSTKGPLLTQSSVPEWTIQSTFVRCLKRGENVGRKAAIEETTTLNNHGCCGTGER